MSKAFDKIAGAKRRVVGYKKQGTRSMFDSGKARPVTLPATGVATRFNGYHSALKPAWEVILVFMKPLDGTYAENALRHDQAGFNVDRCRIASHARSFRANREDKPVRNCYGKYGVTNYDGSKGRYPSNILFQHASGCVLTGHAECKTSNSPADPTPSRKPGAVPVTTNVKSEHHYGDRNGRETVEIWECEEGCPIKALREQGGFSRSRPTDSCSDKPGATFCLNRKASKIRGHTDSGYADRFFKVFDPPQPFILAPKTSPRERSSFNTHVAVKPQRVLQYLIDLVSSPENGIILDPFAGSGSTALACLELGVDFICVEREPEYCEIAERRLSEAVKAAG